MVFLSLACLFNRFGCVPCIVELMIYYVVWLGILPFLNGAYWWGLVAMYKKACYHF